jgi:hypothetical protein
MSNYRNRTMKKPIDINERLSKIFKLDLRDISSDQLGKYVFADDLKKLTDAGRRKMRPIDIAMFLRAYGYDPNDWGSKSLTSICEKLERLFPLDFESREE